MDRRAVQEELKNIIGDFLKAQNLNLVEVIYRYEGRDLYLRVLADRSEGGITLDECAQLNNAIGQVLDEKGIIEARYILEVSSPGLDRPLKSENDFLRCIDRRVRCFLREPVNGRVEIEGRIKKAENQAVFVEAKNELIEIPLAKLNRAVQVI